MASTPELSAERERLLVDNRLLMKDARRIARALWRRPELPMREKRSATALKSALCNHGFEIEREFPLVPNAFVATRGNGGPVIGFLAEYDALPDCGPEGRGPGHGCGHNLLGAASTYAAIGLARLLDQAGRSGTVKVFGCPAEETLVGKEYMARDGAFDGLDAALGWHPGASTRVHSGGGTAMDSMTFEFHGKTAHAAGCPHLGRSALDATEIMNVAVNFLREHVKSNVRIHYAIMDGGKAPNVVPSYTRTWYFVRGKSRAEVEEISERVLNCARAGALATDTRMEHRVLTGAYERLPNSVIADMLDANLRVVGAPRASARDLAFVKKLGLEDMPGNDVEAIATSQGSGSSDEANVSWIAPLGIINVACWARGTPGHHFLTHAQVAAPFAMRGMAVAAATLALTGHDLMVDHGRLESAREEFRSRLDGRAYKPIVPAGQPAPLQDTIPTL